MSKIMKHGDSRFKKDSINLLKFKMIKYFISESIYSPT